MLAMNKVFDSPTGLKSIRVSYRMYQSCYIRGFALTLTILCTFTLYLVGEPRSYPIAIPRGFLNSLILNAPLWLASLQWVRVKLKYLISILIFFSSLGVFLATPWGWILAFLSLAFHFWFIADLIRSKESL